MAIYNLYNENREQYGLRHKLDIKTLHNLLKQQPENKKYLKPLDKNGSSDVMILKNRDTTKFKELGYTFIRYGNYIIIPTRFDYYTSKFPDLIEVENIPLGMSDKCELINYNDNGGNKEVMVNDENIKEVLEHLPTDKMVETYENIIIGLINQEIQSKDPSYSSLIRKIRNIVKDKLTDEQIEEILNKNM